MKRTTERWIWIGAILLLVVIGAVLFLGPASRMIAMCQGTTGDGMMQDGGARPIQPSNQ